LNQSPYAKVGPKLVDSGYSAIPVLPHSKRPGTRSRGQWYGDLDWTRFCDRLPTDIEVGVWERYPDDAGVCIALGKASGGLVAIDVDTDDHRVQEAIESVLPPSPVQKAGRKGYTGFYRAREAVVSCAFNVKYGERALDLLAHGKQTIVPPTLHPDTGKPYIWITASTLLDVTPDRLPMLPDDIADRLGAVLAPHGYYAPVERPPVDSDGGIWREVNDVALERFDQWLPHLGIDAKRLRNGTWRGRAIWKNAENSNVGFAPNGIKDFGSDKGMTAIDVVMESFQVDFSTAEKWLREKLGFKEPPPVVFLLKVKDRIPDPIIDHDPAPHYWPESTCNPFDPKAAGGLLGQTAEWIYSGSIKPSRELSMLAALGVMSVFAGRRYVGPTGLTSALYLVGVAPTGAGKDHPISAAKNLLMYGNMAHLLGSGDYSSDSAMEKLTRHKPAHLAVLDEIGAWLQETIARGAPAYKKARRKLMLELYTNSKKGGIYLGKDTVASEKMASSEPVFCPSLSILGMSTATLFFKGLSEENMSDGLIARLTVVNIKAPGEWQDIVPLSQPPHALTGAYRDALDAWGVTGKAARTNVCNATMAPALHDVPFDSPEAEAASKAFRTWQDGVLAEDPQAVGYASRVSEQSLKIALIRAVSRDPTAPKINVDDLAFGRAFVTASVESLKAGIQEHMHGSDFEERYKVLLRHVHEAGEKGITDTELRRKSGVSKIEPRHYNEATKFLTEYHRWIPKKGKRGYRYFPIPDGHEAVDAD
jgi:hypothetical protein